jgi:Trypsin-like peptidase domain
VQYPAVSAPTPIDWQWMEASEQHYLYLKAVRLEGLDERGDPIEVLDAKGKPAGKLVASGFLMRHSDGLYLYTCWHVVTGIDLHNAVLPGARSPKRRMKLRVSMQMAEVRAPGMIAVGGKQVFEVNLYDASSTPPRPLWEQDRDAADNEALEMAGLLQPYWHDAVRIRVPDSVSVFQRQVLAASDFWTGIMIAPGESLLLVGYPYGYSALEDQPTPVVLSRAVAAMRLDGTRRTEVLLDGGGAPGMSGGPVFVLRDGRLHLFGMYTGVLYPDGPRQDPERSTALGTVCDLALVGGGSLSFLQPRVVPRQ